MTKRKAEATAERKRYSAAFKQQALLRAMKDGVSVAAHDLGLQPTQLYAWRSKAQQQGQYAWRDRKPSARAQRRAELDAKVLVAFEAERGRAGAPRLCRRLRTGRRQVAESLRRQGLRAKAARKFKATTNSNHELPVWENRLQQDFTAERRDQVWGATSPASAPARAGCIWPPWWTCTLARSSAGRCPSA